jgi:hypothetical protein
MLKASSLAIREPSSRSCDAAAQRQGRAILDPSELLLAAFVAKRAGLYPYLTSRWQSLWGYHVVEAVTWRGDCLPRQERARIERRVRDDEHVRDTCSR